MEVSSELRWLPLLTIRENVMFRCPVCKHATFNWIQYTLKSGVSTVECSNCHTIQHQVRRAANLLVVLPFALVPLSQFIAPPSPIFDVIWLALCTSLALWIATRTAKLEPIDPEVSARS